VAAWFSTVGRACDGVVQLVERGGRVVQFVERGGGVTQLVRPWSTVVCPDAVVRRCQAVYSLWWLSWMKDMQTEQLLCWTGMTNTQHTTSGSSEEETNVW